MSISNSKARSICCFFCFSPKHTIHMVSFSTDYFYECRYEYVHAQVTAQGGPDDSNGRSRDQYTFRTQHFGFSTWTRKRVIVLYNRLATILNPGNRCRHPYTTQRPNGPYCHTGGGGTAQLLTAMETPRMGATQRTQRLHETFTTTTTGTTYDQHLAFDGANGNATDGWLQQV